MQDTYHLWEDGSYCQLLPCAIVKHLIFIPAVPEWLQEAVQLGTSVRKLILPLAAQILWAALYATLSCKAWSPISHFQAGYFTEENLHSALAGTPPLSKQHPQAKLPERYASWTGIVMLPKPALMINPHDMIMKLEAQLFRGQRSSRAAL